jgi:hypothetical protein
MKFSDRTIALLHNYSTINSNIVFRPGRKLRTMTETKNIFAETTIEEDIPTVFGLYDLPEFLGVMRLIDDPDLEITDSKIVIQNADSRIEYFCSDPHDLTEPPLEKSITLPSTDIELTLAATTLNKLREAQKVLKHKTLRVMPSDAEGKVKLAVVDPSATNQTTNSFAIDVDGSFNNDALATQLLTWQFDHLKMVTGDYTLRVSAPSNSVILSEFTNLNDDLTYFVALDKN